MLVFNFQPEFLNRHLHQMSGIEGLDLEAVRRHQILVRAKNMPLDSIRQFSSTEFCVASESWPGHYHPINLNQPTCNCDDFPRIWYCKHIAAIHVHFPQLFPKGSNPSEIPERVHASDPPQRAPSPEEGSTDILKDINVLCQQLNAVSDPSILDLQALQSVRIALKMVTALAKGSRALPEIDDFSPNQKTWTETAVRMGVRKKSPKRKDSPVGRNTEQRIGASKGKRSRKYSDPYAAGERSGKRAKPDAVSTAANECACARAAVPTPTVHPLRAAVLAPTCTSPSTAATGSAAPFFHHANLSAALLLAHSASSAGSGLAFLHLSAALPGRVFAPPSGTGLGLTHAEESSEKKFRAEIMPGIALADVFIPRAPPDDLENFHKS